MQVVSMLLLKMYPMPANDSVSLLSEMHFVLFQLAAKKGQLGESSFQRLNLALLAASAFNSVLFVSNAATAGKTHMPASKVCSASLHACMCFQWWPNLSYLASAYLFFHHVLSKHDETYISVHWVQCACYSSLLWYFNQQQVSHVCVGQ